MGQSIGEVMLPPRPRRAAPALAAAGVALAVVLGGAVVLRGRATPSNPAEPAPPRTPPLAAAPPPAAPAPPASGRLHLHVDNGPADRILVDGRPVGSATSDVDVADLAVGPHQVTIEAADRPPQAASVLIAPGASAALTLSLSQRLPTAGTRRTRSAGGHAESSPVPPGEGRPRIKPSRAEEHGLMDSNPFRNP